MMSGLRIKYTLGITNTRMAMQLLANLKLTDLRRDELL